MQFNILQKAMIDAMKARDKQRKDSIAVLVSAAKEACHRCRMQGRYS